MSTEMQSAQNTGMEVVVVHTSAGDVRLTPAIVRKYLVNGNGAVTDQEIALFLGLCKAQQLNPFTREAYLIKYGGTQPAAIVVAKDVFLKRAYRSESFRGHKAGIICQVPNQDELVYTQGICPPGAKIVGGWAEVHTDKWAFPLRVEVDFNEYLARKSDGTTNRMWSEKPATMIRKVALVHALREAFPDSYQGMYSEEEVPTDGELPRAPVEAEQVVDVGEGTSRAPAGPSAQAEHRRRRNRFRVDPLIFGSDEILTCGSTDKQLAELYAIAKAIPGAKDWITDLVRITTGYDQWSFLREDEALEILRKAREHFASPRSGDERWAEDSPGPVDAPHGEQAIPDDLVDCPAGDRVSVSRYCRTVCRERQAQGWCPVVDDPPEMEGGML